MLANVAQQGVAFLTVVLVARLLTPEEFAHVRIAVAYTAVAAIIAGGGFSAPVLRYCADTAFDAVARRRIVGVGLQRVGWVSALAAAAALALVFARRGDPVQTAVLGVYALQLPGLAAGTLLLVYLQAMQRFKLLAAQQVALRVATLALSVVGTYFWGLTGFLVAALLAAYLTCIPLWLAARPSVRTKNAQSLPSDFNHLALYSLVGTLVTALGQYSDLMILDGVGTDRGKVAAYSLATIFFAAVVGVGGAVQSVATPAFTALIDQPEQFKRQLRRWSVGLSLAGLPVASAAILLAAAIERWFLAAAYAGLSAMVALLMVKFCVWCTIAVSGAALVGIGAIREGTWVAVVTTAMAIVAGVVLSSRYGVWGAAATQVGVAFVGAALVLRLTVAATRDLARRAVTADPSPAR